MGLFDNLKNLPSLNEIKGSFGEQLTKYYSKITTDGLILHDVLIDGAEGMTSQIDMLIIDKKGIFVVEVKMYENATIYGNGNKNKWFYYLGGNKYEIYSPLQQNRNHIKHLKNFLKDFTDIPFFSILFICCKDFKVSDINKDTDNPYTFICNSLPSMSKGIQLLSGQKPDILTSEQQKQIFDYVSANQYADKEARQQHKEKVLSLKDTISQNETENICPYCKTPLVLRKGKFGDFYGCTNYPKCRYTKNINN